MRKFSFLVPMRGLTTGDLQEMMLLGGQSVGLIESVEPVADVIDRMIREAAMAIRAAAVQDVVASVALISDAALKRR